MAMMDACLCLPTVMHTACCSAITQLALNDSNAHHIVQVSPFSLYAVVAKRTALALTSGEDLFVCSTRRNCHAKVHMKMP